MANSSENILISWLGWQFVKVPKFLLEAWQNYIYFALDYFSLPILLKSFFAPWRKYRWNYPRGFDLVEFFNTLVSNAISRVLGALVRVVLIVAGILFQIFVLLAGAAVFLFWILVPFIIVAGILWSLI